MKSYRKELWFEVPTRRAFVNITPEVEECLRASGINEGLVLVNAMHITASVLSPGCITITMFGWKKSLPMSRFPVTGTMSVKITPTPT
jgi:hypothetical protein